MSIITQISVKAEHGPYWLRICETEDGVCMEDIFSCKDKQPAMDVGSWPAAIQTARKALNQWDGKIEGFENYVDIEDAGWTDIVIAYHTLSDLYPNDRDHLKKWLASCKNFDTGKSWTEEDHRALRVMAIDDLVLLEVSRKLPELPALIRQCVSSEDEIELSDDLIDEICEELENHPTFDREVVRKAVMPRNTPYEQIMQRIALLEQWVEGQLDENRGLCNSITQNYLQGSLTYFSVVVQIPNVQQRGLVVTARSTAELFQKIARQINLGPDATITYSQILSMNDFVIDRNEAYWECLMENKLRLQWEDISFDNEISEIDGKLVFYVPVTLNLLRVLGLEYGILGSNPSVNVYATYDLQTKQIQDNLSVIVIHTDRKDEERYHPLTPRERDMFLRKMNQYCVDQTGKDLSHWDEAE